MFLIFDTETTGLPRDFNAPITDLDNWPRLVQLAWQMHDAKGDLVEVKNFIVKPEGFSIPFNAEKIHGISTDMATRKGVALSFVLEEFNKAIAQAEFLVGHNIGFDINIMGAEYLRKETSTPLLDKEPLDTKDESTEYCAIPGGRGGKFKWPTLTELHQKLFGEGFSEAHNASADVEATARCFLELVRLQVVTATRMHMDDEFITQFLANNPSIIQLIGLNIKPYEAESEETLDTQEEQEDLTDFEKEALAADIAEMPFSHLHVHTQFSVLQSSVEIKSLIKRAKALNMEAVALTDHANMMAAFHFVRAALANDIKPIVGCEFNVCDDHTDKSRKDNGRAISFLAKHKAGYHNLSKLCSTAHIDGFYYVPRVDKNLIEKYKEGLIATTGGLNGEIPYLILNVGEEQAEQAFCWWHEQFGDDFYIELMRHGLDEEEHLNRVLLGFARKYNVKYFASNNVYYLGEDDSKLHDVLLAVKENLQVVDLDARKIKRFLGCPNDEFYFKTQDQMKALFKDLPAAMTTVKEIVDKTEGYALDRDVLLPAFDIEDQFKDPEDEKDNGKRGENNFLRHLTYEGAKERYGEVTDSIRERLDFELATIANTGYPGYFLIVQDFTTQARVMGVSVGPGRGSAAGSAVAYCIGITNVDPIKYDLLFERFLNPDRVSLPDIDIDFDDRGRDKVIEWVVNKYGKNQVAQIITYGTMAAKSSIRDVSRVTGFELSAADRLAKLVPGTPGMTLKKAYVEEPQLGVIRNTKNQPESELLELAERLEGSVRNTGIHACGVIITPDDITKYIPVTTSKDADLLVTQFDNSVVEDAGMLKMDFLGLKTLTIIKDAIRLVKERHGVHIDPDEIPLDDAKTYELYQKGETNGTFQFESPGMQKHLKALVPDTFADLIAMNALYRPGPLEYIPNFIDRKHGREEIVYDIADMEGYLAETYGITVYQEQVMLLSQKLAGFTKGMADSLRKAMGKKKKEIIDQLKPKFLEGCKERGHDTKVAEKVWKDWEAFAAYAFNKSHSTCYSVVAFHTGYLKANYPAEYMASVMTHNMSDIKKVTFFMEECKRMGMEVLGPDVNESALDFTVNKKGEVRFGLGAIKGVGEGAVLKIIEEREEGGDFKSIFDLTSRIDLRSANRKTLESLVLAGAFDSFGNVHRAQYFAVDNGTVTFLEKAIKYGHKYQENLNSSQASLFGESSGEEMPEPDIPPATPWGNLEKLNKEKEVVGVFISGHPLDEYKLEMTHYCNTRVEQLENLPEVRTSEVRVGGIISDFAHRTTKNGRQFGTLTIEDYSGSFTIFLFSEDYLKFRQYFSLGLFLYIQGKVESSRWKPDQLEFKVLQMDLLTELMEKKAKSIDIVLNFDGIDEAFVDSFHQLIGEHQGNCALKLRVQDPRQEMSIEMSSRTLKVALNSQFVSQLDDMDVVAGYKLR